MASEADQAEQRVHEQRRLIEEKLARLETRVKDDISTAQAAVRERTDGVTQSIPGRRRIEEQVGQRPLTSMAAGLAAGIGLGMLSESVSIRGNGRSQSNERYDNRSAARSNGSDSGLMSRLAGPATAAILAPIQDQLQEFVASALSGLSRGDSQRQHEHPEGQLPAAAASRRQPERPIAPRPGSGDQ